MNADRGEAVSENNQPKGRRWTPGAITIVGLTGFAVTLQVVGIGVDNDVGWLAGDNILGLVDKDFEFFAVGASAIITAALAVLAVLYANGSERVLKYVYNIQSGTKSGVTAEELRDELERILGLLFTNQIDELKRLLPAEVVVQVVDWLEKFRPDLAPLLFQITEMQNILRRIERQDVARISKDDLSFLQQYADSALKQQLEQMDRDLTAANAARTSLSSEIEQAKNLAAERLRGLDDGVRNLTNAKVILDELEILAEKVQSLASRARSFRDGSQLGAN